jgi:1-acyl-sn-glycerol-3-phosphate acyltransferase
MISQGSDRAFADPVASWRRVIRYRLVRLALAFVIRAYVRLRAEHLERLPAAPYLICFNHLNWTDPFMILVVWPPSPRVFFYGPREQDMGVGARNKLIGWVGTAVPFKPAKSDLLTSTRRAVAVLHAGQVLAIAGEGTVGIDENDILPLNEGAAYFAIRARVPIVPVAINGTRWLRFGKTIRVRVGEPIRTEGLRADRPTVEALTARLRNQLRVMVADYRDTREPGRFGRWLTERFNERPWLDAAATRQAASAQIEEADRENRVDAEQ